MKNIIVLLLLVLHITWNGYSQQINYGPAVSDVRFAIASSNSTSYVGSLVNIHCWLNNGSSNSILFFRTGILEVDFSAISLVDQTGRTFNIRPHIPTLVMNSITMSELRAGHTNECDIKVIIPDTIRTNDYKLLVRQHFVISNMQKPPPYENKEVVSNQLNISIK